MNDTERRDRSEGTEILDSPSSLVLFGNGGERLRRAEHPESIPKGFSRFVAVRRLDARGAIRPLQCSFGPFSAFPAVSVTGRFDRPDRVAQAKASKSYQDAPLSGLPRNSGKNPRIPSRLVAQARASRCVSTVCGNKTAGYAGSTLSRPRGPHSITWSQPAPRAAETTSETAALLPNGTQ